MILCMENLIKSSRKQLDFSKSGGGAHCWQQFFWFRADYVPRAPFLHIVQLSAPASLSSLGLTLCLCLPCRFPRALLPGLPQCLPCQDVKSVTGDPQTNANLSAALQTA